MNVVLKSLIAISLFHLALSAHSQITALQRYEKEIKHSEDGFTIISLKEKGIALIRDRNKYEDGKRNWGVTLLDTNLEETWNGDIPLTPRFNLIGFDAPGDEFIYFLFREGDVNTSDLQLVRLNTKSKETNNYNIKHEFNFRLTHFSVISTNALLGGYVNQEPAVLLYEVATQKMKVLPGFFLKDTELLDLRVNKNNTFNTLLMERNASNHRNLFIRTFDFTGVQLLEDKIEIDKEKNVLSGITSQLQREELLIFGTYGLGNSKQASGYYVATVDPFEEHPVHYYNLTSLEHFLDYMKPKRAAKIKSKNQRRIDAGKAPIFKSYLQPLRLYETDEGFTLLAESYDTSSDLNQPYWSNNFYYPYYGNGYVPYRYRPYSNRYYNSPYAYNPPEQNNVVEMIETVATAFDPSGKLVWDHSLKLDGRKREGIEQTGDLHQQNDDVYLIYRKEQDLMINKKIIGLDSIQQDTVKVPLKNVSDYVRYDEDEDSGVRQWFGNTMFTWGYQSIRDKSGESDSPVRYVFYIIKFEID